MKFLKNLLEEQKQYLATYFDQLNLSEVEKAIEACTKVKGLVVFTGVGKSGIIAEKIAMTLVSTGTKALYLPPTNFLHGDIGVLSEQDLLILLSRSGESEELLTLLPYVQKRNTPTVAVVSTLNSRLAKACDLSVYLPVEKELCPFNLAPTTSTTVQLLFGDLLAISLMHLKQFDISRYALNHPSGSIGKKATVKVDDLMFKGDQLPVCKPEHRLIEVLVELSNKKCGTLLIVGPQEELLGVFTDGDLRRALQKKGSEALEEPISTFMSTTPLSIQRGELAWDAVNLMQKDPKKYVTVLPVLEGKKVVGILRMHDIVQAGVV